ncbi:aspartyl-tRNA synthetase [Arthroderma uncinatum]|uniref:aspartyl-tRNA synthetase n=1 Tax=Arthroderma uncinatum TaxID=74035 RepID=UPI00144AA84C|nr:aspartyl-tRNA synthetase [Arthroderma uncinatum]KAF3483945.1 aspartyl-tRNA synthetase [Arthroderma uncinatum]
MTMMPVLRSAARPLRLGNAIARRQSFIEISNYFRGRATASSPLHLRCALQRGSRLYSSDSLAGAAPLLEQYSKSIQFPPASTIFGDLYKEENNGKVVIVHGYIGKRRKIGKNMTFVRLTDPTLSQSVQIVVSEPQTLSALKAIEPNSAVVIHGIVKSKENQPQNRGPDGKNNLDRVEVELQDIQCLNEFPKDIIVTADTVFPPNKRHLQIRNDDSLRQSLAFRAKANAALRRALEECEPPFLEVETPILFKSTPEGAREFLVPTRNQGLAYALPQSPQQYKQMLMASGIPRYYQFARCFRDEDLRADRQPEFTQLDMEMSFATAEDVMTTTESLVKKLWASVMPEPLGPEPFPRMSYHEAMGSYGSDKPDTRFDMKLHRVDQLLPSDFISKISSLSSPAVEAFKVEGNGSPQETMEALKSFMESPEGKYFNDNPDGGPGTFVFDSTKPVSGLFAVGFEGAWEVEQLLELNHGDLVVFQARKHEPFSGGSTRAGELRLAIQKHMVELQFHSPPAGFNFHWVTGFPLFSPSVESEPGQGGTAGIASTHHPFTAPRTPEDATLLLTDPTKAIADHYDLVVNGVELGGGSRRIHSAAVQEFVLREILKIPPSRLESFSHLLECLRAGCPPHAGIALGFDRLIAMMRGTQSVRNVIAFPKGNRGEDPMVKTPSPMTEESLQTYHLQLRQKA